MHIARQTSLSLQSHSKVGNLKQKTAIIPHSDILVGWPSSYSSNHRLVNSRHYPPLLSWTHHWVMFKPWNPDWPAVEILNRL